ncbi:MAG: hypothetical protein KIH64_006270 [Mycobacterium sp.]|nr:hypothetical protein [Mycobacterium sp.]
MADTVSEARERYREQLEAAGDQRRQIEQDLAFSDPSDPQQWDAAEKAERETDPGGARPCLVMDQTGQYVANVAGQVEQRPPALHAIPVDGGADRRVAEQLDGFFRHIEHTSRAQQHYARALTSAARAGVGYLIVLPDYIDRALGYQEPRISSEGDPLRVVFDAWSTELDGSDATCGWLQEPLSERAFERQFGDKAEKVSFDTGERTDSKDERKSILVVQQWLVVEQARTMVAFTDADGNDAALSEDEFQTALQRDPRLKTGRTYRDKYRCVKWCRMSGAEVLTEEVEYPASGIGLIPVYGYVGWAGGRMTYCGIPRRARQPQQAYNYHVSEIRALMSQAPKAPWLMPMSAYGADENIKRLWDRASVESRATLPYQDWDAEHNRVVSPPSRMPLAVDLRNHVQGAMQAREDIQAALGMYQANLGAPSNETSGVAIENRKEQGEASTSHFPAHLAASLGQVGKLCMEMIPRLIDTKRQLRILGIDQTPGRVTIDPEQEQAFAESEGGLSINPNVGKYDVRIVAGASFSTQRQQAQQAYTEMMRANPQMMPAIAPLWAQTLDVPHADKLAQVLTAVAPDPVKAILQPDQTETTATLKAQNDQLKQALEEATTLARDAQQDADEAQAEVEKLKAESAVKEDEIAIKAYDARTKRLQVMGTALTPDQVAAIAHQAVLAILQQPEPGTPGDAGPPADDAPPAEPGAGMPPDIQPPGDDGMALEPEPQTVE